MSYTQGDITVIGNKSIWNCEKIGFLASRRVPPETVMRCLDWATQIPHCQHVCASTSRKSRLRGSCVSSQFRLLNCR